MNMAGMQEILEAHREVGLKKANPWGFFDMNGLVQEWCADHWVKSYVDGRLQPTGRYDVRNTSFEAVHGSPKAIQRLWCPLLC